MLSLLLLVPAAGANSGGSGAARLQEEKQTADGDLKFPKIQFPPEYLCPACRADDGSWDTAATVKFLVHYYGPHGADVRGASVTAQSQEDLSDSIQATGSFKLQAPQRPARGDGGGAPPQAPGGPVPPKADSVQDGARGAEPVEELAGEEDGEEKVLDGAASGGRWWKWLLWLVGVWLVVSLFCRCRWCDSFRSQSMPARTRCRD